MIKDRIEAKWKPENDNEQEAYRHGWVRSYYGIAYEHANEDTLDLYEQGKRDGARERQIILDEGGEDPWRW